MLWLISDNGTMVIHPSNVRRVVAQTHCEDGIHMAVSLFYIYKNLSWLKNTTLYISSYTQETRVTFMIFSEVTWMKQTLQSSGIRTCEYT